MFMLIQRAAGHMQNSFPILKYFYIHINTGIFHSNKEELM